ncbi:MAG TPA: hypothetical protein VGK73_24680 [Polyangiaceae bacterium]
MHYRFRSGRSPPAVRRSPSRTTRRATAPGGLECDNAQPGYEIPYNHYWFRLQAAVNADFHALIADERPDGKDSRFAGFSTLTHGELARDQ